MPAPGLIGGLTGLTNPSVQKGIQNATSTVNNAVKGALTSLPGPVGGAYKNIFNTATSISNSMSSNMGRIAQGAGSLGASRGFTGATASKMNSGAKFDYR